MRDKLKFVKSLWRKLTDDGSVRWQQESLNEYGKRYVYDVVMKECQEKPHLRTILVSYNEEQIGHKTFEYESQDEDLCSTIPLDHAQVIINNFEREIKLKLFIHSQKGVVNWEKFKEEAGEWTQSTNKRTMTIDVYGKPREVVEIEDASA
ncbi:pheromone shutdown protein TraB [Croceifilum oryzae]|uniref:Pheromone shutdown protein TraB n=1 Tax=Croceifilum oryzae TaxID=1553429 RepID=A0AAJ1TFL2_9BACL|nr:hypothetical protein [Croceifilum oryzae]MDQ0417993.1 pheromone shutdown protein TraB [Croceifilum oryzae]